MAKQSKSLKELQTPSLMDSAVDLVNDLRDTKKEITNTISDAKSAARDALSILKDSTKTLRDLADKMAKDPAEKQLQQMQNILIMLEQSSGLVGSFTEQYLSYNYIPTGKVSMADILRKKQKGAEEEDDLPPHIPGGRSKPLSRDEVE